MSSFSATVRGLILLFLLGNGPFVYGQEKPVVAKAPRVLAPGILTIIPATPEDGEIATGPIPLVEIPEELVGLDYTPNFEPKSMTVLDRAKGATLRRPIWNLEFAFKPLRLIEVEIPQTTGKMQRKKIWYMVYRVKNNGGHIQPKEIKALIAEVIEHTLYGKETVNELKEKRLGGEEKITELRFFPHFVLYSPEFKKSYLDRVIPSALEPIRRREFPGDKETKLYDSISISEIPVPLSDERVEQPVWGVVTWEDLDPRMDYFSIFIQGLTNAYQFEDMKGAFKKGSPLGSGRRFTVKTLQLNFWRPGDTVEQNEEEVRFGCRLDLDPLEQQQIFKLYGIDKPLDYLWVYR